MSPGKFILATSLIIATTASPVPALALGNEDEISLMRAQLLALSQRLDALEASNSELKQENSRLQSDNEQTAAEVGRVSEYKSASSWADRISIKGDFRQRYEKIDEEGSADRNRSRIRARAAIIANVSENAEVGLGFASGGDDPVSSNQTLGDGGSTKDINLDLAYVKWAGTNNTIYYGGKFRNVLFKPGKHGLLWDGDWNPEGVGLSWDNGDHFVNAMGTWLESDSMKETEFSYAVQAGFRKNLGTNMKLTAGIGYNQLGTKGKGSFFSDDDAFFGNSFDPLTNTYLYDYEELELFADLYFNIGDEPANVFFDYVQNQDARDFDTAFAVGFRYGNAESEGDREFAYIYQDIEADAAFGLLVESDFAGGGTDGRGHILKGGFAIAKNIQANVTYIVSKGNGDLGSERDDDRLQFDLMLEY